MKKRLLFLLLAALALALLLPTAALANDSEIIRNVSVSIDVPVAGNTPNYTPNYPENASYFSKDYSNAYFSQDVLWQVQKDDQDFSNLKISEAVFELDRVYSVVIYVTAKSGYRFSSAELPAVTFNGSSAGVTAEEFNTQLKITYTFPRLGKCGDALRSTLDDQGTLTISGSGEMYDFTKDHPAPWSNVKGDIKKIVVDSGVTSIGRNAFTQCHKVETIELPATLTTIRSYAFNDVNVKTLTLSEGLKTIEKEAFIECMYLTAITIPASVENLFGGSFDFCDGIRSFTVAAGNKRFTSVNGVIFSKDKTKLIAYPIGNTAQTYAVPAGVREIVDEAFQRAWYLGEVTLPSGVEKIGMGAFNGCLSLTSISLPATVKQLGLFCFYRCEEEQTIEILYGGTREDWSKLTFGFASDEYLSQTSQSDLQEDRDDDAQNRAYWQVKYFTGWKRTDGGSWTYYKDGTLATGWVKDAGSGKWYYLGTDSVMKTGWVKDAGKWYYLNTEMKTGWQLIAGKWYYLGTNGAMVTGWTQVNGKWYYLGADGAMRTGWQQVSGKWYYLNSDMKTGWQQISGYWYYLGTDGAMRTGWTQVSGKWYYLGTNGVMRTGWAQVNGKWYYLGTDGAMKTGWAQVSGYWYYLGADGAMRTGWQQIAGKWYYLGTNGAMVTGWLQQNGKWYYLKTDGSMAASETLTIDGKRYRFNASGVWVS